MSKRIHFIGIGGTGISAIALMLLQKGWQVSGSDAKDSVYFRAVCNAGAEASIGSDPKLVCKADLVVRSSAIPDSNADVVAAQEAGIPVLHRREFLPELTKGYDTLAIAGSHGKTTTTAMLITALQATGNDPSFILGAQLKSSGANAHLGTGSHFVIEADEYDNMFLGLSPKISVITNIEHDHPDCFPTEADYLAAFEAFAHRTLSDGVCLICGDDKLGKALLAKLGTPGFKLLSYGQGEENDYRVSHIQTDQNATHFDLSFRGECLGSFHSAMPGKHNALNAAASLSVLQILGYDLAKAGKAVAQYAGSERRFDKVYDQNGVVILDDYGHHPTQLRVTLEAAKAMFPGKTLWAVWEPHTFSRTQSMEKEFTESLRYADRVVITRIYAAREADHGYTPQGIADGLSEQQAQYLPDFDEAVNTIASEQKGNDVILVFSAGKGPEISRKLAEKLSIEVKA